MFAEVPAKEEGSDSDASDASDATDEDEDGSFLSEELETEKPAAQKRKNEYHEEEEKGVKCKKASVSILFLLTKS